MDYPVYLREKGLKATPVRLKALELLCGSNQAFTHTDLERTLDKVDRITLYRVLKDFEEAGIVHKVMDLDGVTRYGVCRDTCPHATHVDEHAHFSCGVCHKVYCLEKSATPSVNLPAGFRPSAIQTMVHGTCRNCC